jgi:hypothetical protein
LTFSSDKLTRTPCDGSTATTESARSGIIAVVVNAVERPRTPADATGKPANLYSPVRIRSSFPLPEQGTGPGAGLSHPGRSAPPPGGAPPRPSLRLYDRPAAVPTVETPTSVADRSSPSGVENETGR